MLYGDDPIKFGGVYVPAIAAMLQSGNLYVYCMNNPLLYFDSDGAFALSNKAKVIIGAVALTAAVALTVATGGGAAIVAAGVAKVVGSVALSTAVSAGLGYLENGKQGAIDGAANGFMFASLSVAGGAAVKYAKAAKAARAASGIKTESGFSARGYNPKPGERTIEGYVRNNANPEISLRTKSSGFNNHSGKIGGVFKRYGSGSHGGLSPHVHQPLRHLAPDGSIFGSVGSKTVNGGVTTPSAKDVKQLYEYLVNGKYH